ncbi:ATP-dependent nuclease [Escherichia coli]|uniref:ATP-dependent endonuclease of the OLD family-like protein n=1 Tax=Shimwellia blattae (strain ATCC 29907 / DSM 4481 / JCM 1650 / NBRC 105725 / CDC 9005-74) TaxID=630626 RepID=I2B6A2_SHIBC|nr:AAA family ATPase [Shimwellia blattae]EFD9633907.1 AAA family ATPase [Escherichia coli]AFJ46056.1 ATP-dependent endonuclease of the OLD family-like protein [Shimwellia blattae DSM 4481 = NBRC 105725]EIT7421135.1 AAA family ATPase [Escherichia coli]VDY63529.1 Predicted ATPase [Shimwellia blattae]VEC21515.1 Predicted ATPase [Shimwellia blattae]
MKISFFGVNNFRTISGGIDNNKIIFKDTNTLFIYGANNAGKSTFLKAYMFFYSNEKPIIDDFFKRDGNNSIEFELEVQLDELDKERIEAKAPKQKESYKKYLNNDYIRIKKVWRKDGAKIEDKNYTFDYSKGENGEYDEIGYATVGLHTVFQSCLPKPVFIKAMPTEEEAKKILNEILKMMAESTLKTSDLEELKAAQDKIKELQDKMYDPELIETYQSSVNGYFNKIFGDTAICFKDQKDRVIWTENKLGRDFEIEFMKKNSQGDFDQNIPSSYSSVGHGTIRTAIFTLLLMRDVAERFERRQGRKDYMVLFEEPELFLYPRMVKELRELIYQVSTEDLPYQVLCASHSSSMIDLSKPKSSIIRLVNNSAGTKSYQINDQFLKDAKGIATNDELKQEMYEVLRFNPYICESFYADEVLLIEGPTEEIISRAFLQEVPSDKTIFVLNCGTVNNIPFYQKIFSRFNIKYHVICDTDKAGIVSVDQFGNADFDSGIQKTISEQYRSDCTAMNGNIGLLRTHNITFEPAHQDASIPDFLRFVDSGDRSKPFNANLYWKDVLKPNIAHQDINKVPIIKYLNEIMAH